MDSNIQNVVIDTNVIVSAFLSSHDDVATVLVLNKLYKNEIRLYYSKEVLAEYKDVLNREKFKFDKREINRFINYVLEKGIVIEPEKINEELIDKKDLPFYEIVMDKSIKESKLITGNIKHFPVKPFIMTPTEFIKIFGK
ncbi:MAG: putative toxin-antitoxin system toxin component, PIN family [Lachnospiraceae bacterium]|nr:putative toxin-antitoxin system toxin component, PIN family [Lachnospiraceae bacterium]